METLRSSAHWSDDAAHDATVCAMTGALNATTALEVDALLRSPTGPPLLATITRALADDAGPVTLADIEAAIGHNNRDAAKACLRTHTPLQHFALVALGAFTLASPQWRADAYHLSVAPRTARDADAHATAEAMVQRAMTADARARAWAKRPTPELTPDSDDQALCAAHMRLRASASLHTQATVCLLALAQAQQLDTLDGPVRAALARRGQDLDALILESVWRLAEVALRQQHMARTGQTQRATTLIAHTRDALRDAVARHSMRAPAPTR